MNRDRLCSHIAETYGFELFRHYSEKQAAFFLSVHPITLKKLRHAGKIAFIRKGNRSIAYFGFQVANYLVRNIEYPANDNHRGTDQ